MNLERKCQIQKRQIESFQNQIKDLEKDIAIEKRKNSLLMDRINLYELKISSVEDIKRELFQEIEEVRRIKENYQKAVSEAHEMKNQYSLKFKKLIGRFLLQI